MDKPPAPKPPSPEAQVKTLYADLRGMALLLANEIRAVDASRLPMVAAAFEATAEGAANAPNVSVWRGSLYAHERVGDNLGRNNAGALMLMGEIVETIVVRCSDGVRSDAARWVAAVLRS